LVTGPRRGKEENNSDVPGMPLMTAEKRRGM